MVSPSLLRLPSSNRITPTHDLDLETLHSAPPTTSCAHIPPLLSLSHSLSSNSTFPFSSILDISTHIATTWAAASSCSTCRHDRHVLLLLPLLAEQVLGVYEAAGLAYDIASSSSSSPDYAGDDDAGVEMSERQSKEAGELTCEKSEMRIGQLELEGREAKLLARVVLKRRVAKLGGLLEELKEVASELWGEGWTQGTGTLRVVEERIGGVMERLVNLLGMLR
uniref:ScyR11 n=1 Tax=Scytalidium album TaxID=1525810 RepID=A0A8A5D789_9PEZI|nr:ScyR11 [Scytalidium album]